MAVGRGFGHSYRNLSSKNTSTIIFIVKRRRERVGQRFLQVHMRVKACAQKSHLLVSQFARGRPHALPV